MSITKQQIPTTEDESQEHLHKHFTAYNVKLEVAIISPKRQTAF